MRSRIFSGILAALILFAAFVPFPAFADQTSGDWQYTVSGGKATVTKYTGSETNIVIPDTLGGCPVVAVSGKHPSAYVFEGAFDGVNIKSVTIPEGVTSIGVCAFYNCNYLSDVTLPDSVKTIGGWAFYHCRVLKSINIPDSVVSFGEYAFGNCLALKEIDIPDGVTSIASYMFYCCNSLKKVTLPESVRKIEEGAFVNCKALSSLTVPNGVTFVGEWAFKGCAVLESISLPVSLKTVSANAFYQLRSLKRVYYGGTASQWVSIPVGENNDPLASATVYYEHPAHLMTHFPPVAPDCIHDGNIEYYSCSLCGNLFTDGEDESSMIALSKTVLPALGHDFGEWTTATAATCTDAGTEIRVCSRCKTEESRETDALGHDYIAVVTAPTCTETGYTTYICSRCGDSYTADETAAFGHTPGEAVKENERAATCETNGGYDSVVCCTVCGEELSRESIVIPATGHVWGEWTTVTPPTFAADGEEQRVCLNDPSHVENRAIPKLIPAVGDVDGDGRINARDVRAIMRFIVGHTDEGYDMGRADFNGDGKVNSRDVIAILLAIVND